MFILFYLQIKQNSVYQKMDRIHQYHKLSEVKPDYYKLEVPILRATHQRAVFTTKELDLWLQKEFDVYSVSPARKKTGAAQSGITCVGLEF